MWFLCLRVIRVVVADERFFKQVWWKVFLKYASLFVNEIALWDETNSIQSRNFSLPTFKLAKVMPKQFVLFGSFDPIFSSSVDRNRNDFEPLLLVLRAQFFQLWKTRYARRTPSRPKIDKYGVVFLENTCQRHILSVQVYESEIGDFLPRDKLHVVSKVLTS